jgi:CMP-N,N'-diacetyllegionaminic acid synthase
MRALAVIPARGGSKGLTAKALRLLGGRPLLAHTAEAALASRRVARVLLSTDDEAIAEVGRALGLDVPFLRPPALAQDDTPMLPVLQHALTALRGDGFDTVVLLQPTSPLRRAEHIDGVLDLFERTGADSVVSVVEVPHQFNPLSVLAVEGDRGRPFSADPMPTRRQDKPRVFARNGPAVLAVKAAVVERGSLYGDDSRVFVMSPLESVDIDTQDDLDYAEFLLGRARMARQPHR